MKQNASIRKRLHKHGGSKAIDLPNSFIKKLSSDYVEIVESEGKLIIHPKANWINLKKNPYLKNLFSYCTKMPSQTLQN